ncbi:MAG: TonB-dependent receptor, partial [Steroidobacteraceae bacterium]
MLVRNSKTWVSAGLFAAGIAAGTAQADEPATETLKLEEIVVVAQKREQNLQDVPIAISAVTGEAMEKSGITSSSDLPTIVPALTVGRQAGSGVTFIRGIGTNNAAVGSEASVALYVDGIYAPFAAVNITNFNNIDHIEVLKGPQGTLFGRNTTGGLVHVVTKDPQQTPALQVKAGYGNYDTAQASLYGTTGITDNIAADLAVYYKDQGNSYLKNSYLDQDYRPEEDLSFRSKWLFNLGERSTLTLAVSGSDSEGSSGVTRQPAPGSLGLGGQPYSGDFYDLPSDWDARWHNKSKAVTARFEHDFSNTKFVSLTGWRDDEQKYVYSADSAIIFFQNLLGDMFSKAVSQEFQLLSNDDGGPLSWVVGLYLYDNKTGYDDLDIIVPASSSPIVIDDEQHTRSYSVFGEGRWQFTDATGLTLGARYSRDEVELSGNTFATANRVSIAGPYKDDTNFDEPTWRLGVDHRFNPDLMAYFTYSHGYKMGFYNAIPASGVVAPPVGPEKLDAFEVGLKSDLLAGQLRLNAAAFYYDFKDIQVVTLIPPVQRNTNAAKSSLYGGEVEAQYRATTRLTLNLGLSLLHATF